MTGPAAPPDLDELLDLEHAGWQALCTAGGAGAAFYGGLMTDGAVMVLGNGQVMRRDDVVAALSDSPPWDTYTIADPELIEIADGVTGVVYDGTGRRGDVEFRGAMVSVYVATSDGWRLALYQQTPVS